MAPPINADPPSKEQPSVLHGFWEAGKKLTECIINSLLLLLILGVILPTMLRLAQGNYAIDSSDVVALRRSIIGQESAGNFSAVNPDSGALGYGQVMPENVAPWSKDALGYALTPEEFLAHPDLQLTVLNHKLTQYWEDALIAANGDKDTAVRMVASRWYSGRADWYNSTAPQYYNGTEYPSIQAYTLSILERYRQEQFR
jgi:hypothetical protein